MLELDKVTQHNAALVQQSADETNHMNANAGVLGRTLAVFNCLVMHRAQAKNGSDRTLLQQVTGARCAPRAAAAVGGWCAAG